MLLAADEAAGALALRGVLAAVPDAPRAGELRVLALVVVGLLASMAGLEYYFLDSGTFIPFCLSWGAGAGLAAGVLGALTPMLSCRSTITRHRKVCGRCCDGKFMAEFCVDLRDGISSLVLSLAHCE